MGVLISDMFKHLDRDAMFNQFNRSGKPYDIYFNKLEYIYNSRAALEVSEFARDKGVYDQVHNLIFSAYFHDGKNIGDPEVLYDITDKVGLNREETAEIIKKKTYGNRLVAAMEEGREHGISAVPTFIFSDNQTLTGAQPLEMFKRILAGGTSQSPGNIL